MALPAPVSGRQKGYLMTQHQDSRPQAVTDNQIPEAAPQQLSLLPLQEPDFPTIEELTGELRRERFRRRYRTLLRSAVYTLVIVAAVSILIATLLLPVLELYGNSMDPTLEEGEIVLSLKSADLRRGDIVAFYYNNRILVKRIIAVGDDVVNMDNQGTVYVNGSPLDEPYISQKTLGSTDVEYPYTVPPNSYFVLGDHRETSMDSRSSIVGCIEQGEIVGKIVFRIWPLNVFGKI